MKAVVVAGVTLLVVSVALVMVTAASAGGGWYLMVPPLRQGGPDWDPRLVNAFTNTEAPLSQWLRQAAFDTGAGCEIIRMQWWRRAQKAVLETDEKAAEMGMRLNDFAAADSALCLSSDDPRLGAAPTRTPPTSAKDWSARAHTGTIPYTPGSPIIATVTLNGRTTARLILDTGADTSMVKPDMLAAAGVDLSRPSARGTGTGIGGNGVILSYFNVVFEVAGHRALVSHVAAFNNENDIADGLLGRDFLDRFKVVMDPAAGTVTLVPR